VAQRKLGKVAKHRVAMLRTLTTQVLLNEKIETTEAKAKEIKPIVDSLIALGIKESKNYENVKVKISKPKLDSKGKKVTEKATSKNGNTYYKVVRETVEVERQKDMPSRLAARRNIMNKIDKIKDSEGNNIDIPSKLFNELAAKYEGRVGGYTRIIKLGARKGDNAPMAILQLV